MTKPVLLEAGADALTRAGLEPAVAVWEDGRRLAPTPDGSEWWYFQVQLDGAPDGVLIIVFRVDYPSADPEDARAQVLMEVTLPEGVRRARQRRYPATEFRAADARCDVHIGPSHVTADALGYVLHADLSDDEDGGLLADLRFTRLACGWRPGTGMIHFGEERQRYQAWLAAAVCAEVTGTLSIDGTRVPVRGQGYHDHNWNNSNPRDLITRWWWGHAQFDDLTLVFADIATTEAYGGGSVPLVLVQRGDEVLAGGHSLRPATDPALIADDSDDHDGFSMLWRSAEGQVTLTAAQPTLISEPPSVLVEIMRRMLDQTLAPPRYRRYRATLRAQIDLPTLSTTVSGPVVYELMRYAR